jgi:hypothetical protein
MTYAAIAARVARHFSSLGMLHSDMDTDQPE